MCQCAGEPEQVMSCNTGEVGQSQSAGELCVQVVGQSSDMKVMSSAGVYTPSDGTGGRGVQVRAKRALCGPDGSSQCFGLQRDAPSSLL